MVENLYYLQYKHYSNKFEGLQRIQTTTAISIVLIIYNYREIPIGATPVSRGCRKSPL